MDLWQRSSLLPPSGSLGSRHDDAAATLGQPRFLQGDPRGSQGGEVQLRQPPPAPPGDLETVSPQRPGPGDPTLPQPHGQAGVSPRWERPSSSARWPGGGRTPRPSGKDPPAKWLWHSFPEALAVVPRPSPLSRPPGTPSPSGGGLRAVAGQAAGGCGRSTPQPGGCGRGTPQPRAGARAPGRFALGGPGMNFASSAGGGAKPRGQGRGARRAARPLGKGRSHSHGSSAGGGKHRTHLAVLTASQRVW